jgi:hypothetical protein
VTSRDGRENLFLCMCKILCETKPFKTPGDKWLKWKWKKKRKTTKLI